VIFYIDRQLTGALREHASTYREHVKKLQDHCSKEFSETFQNLTSDQQIDIIERMESNSIGEGEWKDPAGFFRLILSHTRQGYYGSPIHGGNKDYMSFSMLQLDYPLNVGQNRYKKPLHEN